VLVEGAELADLKQWNAYIQERRMHYNGSYGDEPTARCDFCNTLLEAADAAYSAYNGKPLCGRCKQAEETVIHA
jgi:formylmethanofuran dehydrogenase subunit E